MTIKGLFDGHNKSAMNLLTGSENSYHDIHTAAKLLWIHEDTQLLYGDATFFVTADKNLVDVMKSSGIRISDINWEGAALVKSSSNYPSSKSISGMYKMAPTSSG